MKPLHTILLFIAACAGSFSYGHSIQPNIEPGIVYIHTQSERTPLQCIASAINESQLMAAPVKRSHHKIQLASR